MKTLASLLIAGQVGSAAKTLKSKLVAFHIWSFPEVLEVANSYYL